MKNLSGRIGAAEFDPVSATVYRPRLVQVEGSGESYEDPANPIRVIRTRVTPPMQMYTTEMEQVGHAKSQSNQTMGVRDQGGGDQLTADMWIMHRGIRYDVVGLLKKNPRRGITTYQVNTTNDYNLRNR